MLTILTTCKPCNIGQNDLQQRQAMTTWTFLNPRPEVLVMGTDEGTEEICKDLGFTWVPDVEKTPEGQVPYLDAMIYLADEMAVTNHIALVSSDIILFQPLMNCLEVCRNKFQDFCAICRKQQQRTTKKLDFSNDSWKEVVQEGLRWNLATSGDLFLYNKGFWKDLPKFVVGRSACDSWLFWKASKMGCLVDLTEALTIIDYQHEYTHWNVKSEGIGESERLYNLKLWQKKRATVHDANWKVLEDFSIVEK